MNVKRIILVSLIVAVAGVLIMMKFGQKNLKYELISPEETQKVIEADSNVVLLDVRTPAEFNSESGHLANTLLIPVQELEQRVDELAQYKDKTIIAYCRTGNRSGTAAAILSKKGFKAMNMTGGIVKWNELHLPVVHEKTQ